LSGALSISTDGGTTFTNYTTSNGLGSGDVNGVYVDQNGNVYAATAGGLSISRATPGGNGGNGGYAPGGIGGAGGAGGTNGGTNGTAG
jgi:hypothetical protein